MNGLYASVWAEILKVRKSRMLIITVMAFAGIAITMGLMVFVSRYPELVGNSAMVGAKASMFKDDWSSYFGLLIMIMLTMGTIAFGTITGWVFGREYSDRVVQDLLSLPVHRSTIVLSKFIAIIAWCLLLSLIIFVFGVLTGFAVNIANWSPEIACQYFNIFLVTSIFTILLGTPVALVASYSRGYLAPVGFVIGILIVTQIMFVGTPNITIYFPWAVPAIYSGISGANSVNPNIFSYVAMFSTILLGLGGTLAWWRFADQP